MHDDPHCVLPLDIKQLRQSAYKHEHVQRKQGKQGVAAAFTDLRKSRPKASALMPQHGSLMLPRLLPDNWSMQQSVLLGVGTPLIPTASNDPPLILTDKPPAASLMRLPIE